MKRDMDLVRRLLLTIEEMGDEDSMDERFRDVATDVFREHIKLVEEAGLVQNTGDDITMVLRLTWIGHDFLELARDTGQWQQARSATTSTAIDVLKATLSAIAQSAAMAGLRRLGVPLP